MKIDTIRDVGEIRFDSGGNHSFSLDEARAGGTDASFSLEIMSGRRDLFRHDKWLSKTAPVPVRNPAPSHV